MQSSKIILTIDLITGLRILMWNKLRMVKLLFFYLEEKDIITTSGYLWAKLDSCSLTLLTNNEGPAKVFAM